MNQTSSQLKTLKRTASLDLSKWYMGILLTNLVEKKDTDGAFFLLEATLLPGNEPPPHVHTREDELFCVLEGEFDVYVGEGALEVKTGECILLPKFKPHAFVIRSLGFACSFSTPRRRGGSLPQNEFACPKSGPAHSCTHLFNV